MREKKRLVGSKVWAGIVRLARRAAVVVVEEVAVPRDMAEVAALRDALPEYVDLVAVVGGRDAGSDWCG